MATEKWELSNWTFFTRRTQTELRQHSADNNIMNNTTITMVSVDFDFLIRQTVNIMSRISSP